MKNFILTVTTLIWYFTMKERAFEKTAEMKIVYLANTAANRLFVRKFQGTERYQNIYFELLKLAYMGRNRNGKMILVPVMPSTGQIITARLALGKTSDEIVAQARNIKTKCTNNTSVVFSAIEVATLGTQINSYEDLHGAAKDAAYVIMNTTLKSWLVRIQFAADSNHTGQQIVIIQSTGCIVQGVGGSHEQIFDCFWGIASGTVMLIAPNGGQHSCHDWWYSGDNITWTRIPPTVEANTMMAGLLIGKSAYFRQETVTSKGGTGMSQVISIMVK